MKLSEAIEFTRQVRETWQPTAKGYQTTVINTNHSVRVLGDMDVAEIKPLHFVKIQAQLKTEGKSSATINRVTQALNTVLNTLRKFEMLEKVPHNQQLKEPPGREVVYTEQEIEGLLHWSLFLKSDAQIVHDCILFAVKTGCRQGELLKLQWKHVNFELAEIIFEDTKAGTNRTLPMDGELLELMQQRHRERIDDTIVFNIHKDTLLRRFKLVKKKAGITDPDKCWHSLRHTVCSLLHERGATLPEIMNILGHSQVATTQRYSHASKEGMSRALALL